jgi:hypothetical protein
LSNRRKIRPAPEPRLRALVRVPDPADVDPDSRHGRVLHAPALRRRPPTVAELVELSSHGFDVTTGPRPIVAVDTAMGVRFENLHRAGWPADCGCGTPTCSGEAGSGEAGR